MFGIVDATKYVIDTTFRVGEHVPGLAGFERRMAGVVGGIGSSLSRSLSTGLAAAAGGVGLAAVTKAVVGLHTEVQNAEMGIGSLISALTHKDMVSSLRLARDEVKLLQKDAAAGAGGLQDYIQGFQTIFAPATSAGADRDRIRNLNRLTLNAGFAMRGKEGLFLAPMDVQQALTAGVGDRTTPIANQALRSIGVTNEKFNAMKPAEQLKTLEKAFGSFAAAADVMSQSWDARLATMLDNVKGLAREVTRPLFDAWSEDLATVNDWLVSNHDELMRIADTVGSRLVGAYQRLKDETGPGGLAGGAGALVGAGVGMRVAKPLGSSISGALAASRGGQIGGLVGSAGAALGMSGATLLTGGIALAVVATLALIGTAIASAAAKYPKHAGEAMDSLYRLGDSFGALAGSVTNLITENPILLSFGDTLLTEGKKFADALAVVVDVTTLAVDAMSELSGAKENPGGFMGSMNHLGNGVLRRIMGSEWMYKHGFGNASLEGMLGFTPVEPPKDPPTNKHETNIYGPVTVKVEAERLDDPYLVATTFDAAMRKVSEHRRRSLGPRLVPRPG